jgi:hypothetical protein
MRGAVSVALERLAGPVGKPGQGCALLLILMTISPGARVQAPGRFAAQLLFPK